MQQTMRLLCLAIVVVYMLLCYFAFVLLGPQSGGLPMLDLRALGYSAADVEAYMAALTDAGRGLLFGPVRVLDTLLPILAGALLMLAIWSNGRAYLAPVPLAYSAVDLWENAVTRTMIQTNDLTMAPTASSLTQGKYALLLLSIAILWMAWRERRRRGA